MKTILFQGDSITDCGRGNGLGTGYAFLTTAQLGYECPNEYNFINRGISGNRIVDVYARIKADIINLKPDYMSILIGVNDVWHDITRGNGVDNEKFEKIYSMLIEEIKEIPDRWIRFDTEVKKRAQKAKYIAEKYGLKFVSLQDKFDEAAKKADNLYWTGDGVHPTPMGHELIKNEWIKAFKSL